MPIKGKHYTRVKKPPTKKQRDNARKVSSHPHARFFNKPKEIRNAPRDSWWARPEAKTREGFRALQQAQMDRIQYGGKFSDTPRALLADGE